MTRPEGKKGDTGLMWRASQRLAEEIMHQAGTDDDPRCVVVFAKEAIDVGREALKLAKNGRQRDMTNTMLDACHKIKARGDFYLDAGVMGDD